VTELWNQEAEALTLAAILRYPEEYHSINEAHLVPQDFIGTENQRVMRAVAAVVDSKQEPTMPLVIEELRVKGHDTEYALRLTEQPASPAQAREFGRVVKGLSVNRALANTGARIIEIAREARTDFESSLSEAEKALWKVKQVLPPEEKGISASEILDRMKNTTLSDTIPIRFSTTLQEWTMGYAPNHLWVVGGFSSVGKSAVAVNMAIDTIRSGKSVGILSLEMSAETYMLRLMSTLTGIPQRTLRSGMTLGFEESDSIKRVEASLSRADLYIDDRCGTLDKIVSRARKIKAERGLDMLIVDFIQNVYVTGDEVKDARATAIRLQDLAKELSCTVVGFSQVSNEQAKWATEGGSGNYYSFKGHGAIKDAADIGVMLQRDQQAQSSVLKFNVVKNRHDTMGLIYMDFDLETGRIRERITESGE
jgi:replicative DNA helicase